MLRISQHATFGSMYFDAAALAGTFKSSDYGATEQINLMVLESLSGLSPTIEQPILTLRYADRP
jgi:hypothetical protein